MNKQQRQDKYIPIVWKYIKLLRKMFPNNRNVHDYYLIQQIAGIFWYKPLPNGDFKKCKGAWYNE